MRASELAILHPPPAPQAGQSSVGTSPWWPLLTCTYCSRDTDAITVELCHFHPSGQHRQFCSWDIESNKQSHKYCPSMIIISYYPTPRPKMSSLLGDLHQTRYASELGWEGGLGSRAFHKSLGHLRVPGLAAPRDLVFLSETG